MIRSARILCLSLLLAVLGALVLGCGKKAEDLGYLDVTPSHSEFEGGDFLAHVKSYDITVRYFDGRTSKATIPVTDPKAFMRLRLPSGSAELTGYALDAAGRRVFVTANKDTIQVRKDMGASIRSVYKPYTYRVTCGIDLTDLSPAGITVKGIRGRLRRRGAVTGMAEWENDATPTGQRAEIGYDLPYGTYTARFEVQGNDGSVKWESEPIDFTSWGTGTVAWKATVSPTGDLDGSLVLRDIPAPPTGVAVTADTPADMLRVSWEASPDETADTRYIVKTLIEGEPASLYCVEVQGNTHKVDVPLNLAIRMGRTITALVWLATYHNHHEVLGYAARGSTVVE